MNELDIPELETGKPEVSMAPLIDIVFLLLIFFMVTTVFPDQGLVIEKPASEHAAQLPNQHRVLKLDQHGQVYYRNSKVSIDDVRRLLAADVILQPELSVVINADRRATTGTLIELIDAAKASGARLLGLATDDKRVP